MKGIPSNIQAGTGQSRVGRSGVDGPGKPGLDPQAKALFGGRSVRSEQVESPLRSWNYRPGVSFGEKASHLGHRVLRTVTGWFSKGSARASRAVADHGKYLGQALDAMQNGEADRFRYYFSKLRTEGSDALSRGWDNKDLMRTSVEAYVKANCSDDDLLALVRVVDRFKGTFDWDDSAKDASDDMKLAATLVKGMMRAGATESEGISGLTSEQSVAPPETTVRKEDGPTPSQRAHSLVQRMGERISAMFGKSPSSDIAGMTQSEIDELDEGIRADCETLGVLQDKVLDLVPKTLRELEDLSWERPDQVRAELDAVLEKVRAPLGEAIEHVTQTMYDKVRGLATSTPVMSGDNNTQDRFSATMSTGKRVIGNLTKRYEALARAADEIERRCVLKSAMFDIQQGMKRAEHLEALDETTLADLGKVADLLESMRGEFKLEAMSTDDLDGNIALVQDLVDGIPQSLQKRLDIGTSLEQVKEALETVRGAETEMPAWTEKFGKDETFMRESLTLSTDLYLAAASVRNAKTLSSANGLQVERFNKSAYEFLSSIDKRGAEGLKGMKAMMRDYSALLRGVSVARVEAVLGGGDSSTELEALDRITESARGLLDKFWYEMDASRPLRSHGEETVEKSQEVAQAFAEAREGRSKDFGPSIKGLLTAFEGAVASGRREALAVLEERIDYCEQRGKFGEGAGKYSTNLLESLRDYAASARRFGPSSYSTRRALSDMQPQLREAGVSDKLMVHDARLDFGGSIKLLINRDKTFTSGGPQALKWVTLPRPQGATPGAYKGMDIKEGHEEDRVGFSFKQEANRLKPLSRLTVAQYETMFDSLSGLARR